MDERIALENFQKAESRLTATVPTILELVSKHEYVENWWDGYDYSLKTPWLKTDKAQIILVLFNKDGETKSIKLRMVLA